MEQTTTEKRLPASLLFIALCVITASFFLAACVLYVPAVSDAVIQLLQNTLIHRALRKPWLWISRFKHFFFMAATIPAVILYLKYTAGGKSICRTVKEDAASFFAIFRRNDIRWYAALIAGLFAVSYIKLLVSGFRFEDDIGRDFDGIAGWLWGDSRYITRLLSLVIHVNIPLLPQIAPLPQILTLLILIPAVILLAWLVTDGRINLFSILSASFICLTPFFAGNIAYQFDSPYMALSILLPIAAFLFRKNLHTFIFMSFIFLECTCMTYQASTSIFIVLTAITAWQMWLDKQDRHTLLAFTGAAAAVFAISLILFKLFYMDIIEYDPTQYYSTRVIPSQLGITLMRNSAAYIQKTFLFYGNSWSQILLFFIFVSFIAVSVRRSKRNMLLTSVSSLALLAVTWVLSYGAFLVFERPMMEVRALTGFNVFIAVLCIFITMPRGKELPVLRRTAVILLLYSNIVFLQVFTNAVKTQEKYQDFRCTLLLSDMNGIAKPDMEYSLMFDGSIGYSNALQAEMHQYPLLRELVLLMFRSNNIWNNDYVENYNFHAARCKVKPADLVLIKDTFYHTIYAGKDNTFYVIMKNPHGIIEDQQKRIIK